MNQLAIEAAKTAFSKMQDNLDWNLDFIAHGMDKPSYLAPFQHINWMETAPYKSFTFEGIDTLIALCQQMEYCFGSKFEDAFAEQLTADVKSYVTTWVERYYEIAAREGLQEQAYDIQIDTGHHQPLFKIGA